MSLVSRRAALALGAGALLSGCAGSVRHPAGARPVDIHAYPIASFVPGSAETRFGALEFLSGVELECTDKAFGGFSALRIIDGERRFIAVSDKGHWLTGEMILTEGRISGIAKAEIGPILDADGVPLAVNWKDDTESLAISGGAAFIGIEIENQIYRFEIASGPMAAKGSAIAVPSEMALLHPLYGPESLEVMPANSSTPGAILVIAEDDPEGEGRIPGFIIPQSGAPAQRFRLLKEGRFRPTDCAFLPGGDLLVMERTQSIWAPMQMRLRRVRLAELKDGATISGEVIFSAGPEPRSTILKG